MAYYGLPSAGVIAHELLRQIKQPQSYNPGIPRSETIQNLSVFNSSLQWAARPGDGNYELCTRARDHIARILDGILSPNPIIPQADQSLSDNGSGNELPFLDADFNAMVDDVDLNDILFNLN